MPPEPLPIVDRRAARVIVIDAAGRTLLFRGLDPARPDRDPWWFTPGGGLDAGETSHDAARREVREELGVVVDDLGPVVHERLADFEFDGRRIRAAESYYVLHVDDVDLSTDGWTDLERRVIADVRWWTVEELEATTDTVFPDELVSLLVAHRSD